MGEPWMSEDDDPTWDPGDEAWPLTAEEIAALPKADPSPGPAELPWWLEDEFHGSDEAEHASWLRSLPDDIRAEYESGPWTGAGEAWGAGFLHHDNGPSGLGFASGGAYDTLEPGPELARLVAATNLVPATSLVAAADDDRAQLGESELIGVLCAWQRLTSWAQSGQVASVTTLARRREMQARARENSHLADYVDAEIAAALRLTGRSAGRLLEVSGGLNRLPEVLAALSRGEIDWAKACLFVDQLAGLPDEDARSIASSLLGQAGQLTSGQLRSALARAILSHDPEAAEKRKQAARKEAEVQVWSESSGNSGLAGRELAPSDVINATTRMTALARWLQAGGASGTVEQLRAAVFVALLTGRSIESLLPARPDCASGVSAVDSARVTGTINLTLPLTTWAGLAAAPGELAGFGPADAMTCRDLAIRADTATRWCLTLTDSSGRAVAHALARHGPPVSDDGVGIGAIRWAAGLRERLQFLETGACTHARQVAAYTPPRSLRTLVFIRQRTCSFPGCRRAAIRCDLDHTVPFDRGGKTCECNLAPLCRRHHRTKQAPGWRLSQPQPGRMTWEAPHKRRYETAPDAYPV
jgi:hypothetical protein